MFNKINEFINDLTIYTIYEPFGVCDAKCKAKKKGKKAKKKAKANSNSTNAAFSSTKQEIEDASKQTSNSICDRGSLPDTSDVKLLSNIVQITNNAIDNIDERYNNQYLFDKYYKSLKFNENYKTILNKKEEKLFNFGYGIDNYDELKYERESNLYNNDKNNLFNNDYDSMKKILEKNIYINKEIGISENILEENKKKLENEKEKLINEYYYLNNSVLSQNRNNHYDNLEYEYVKNLITIVLYVYFIFYLVYIFQVFNKTNINYFKDGSIIIILALLPTFIFDNFIIYINNFLIFLNIIKE